MKVHERHQWDLSPKDAIALQQQLADEIIHDRPLDLAQIRYVAGVDVSVKNNVSQSAVVVLSYPELEVVEIARAKLPTTFPYVPGLLSFREGAVLIEAFRQLKHEPDVLIFDGMGRIHPRKIGIASHIGLWLQKPTIGCGKNHLVGEYETPDAEKGSYSMLTYQGETLGVVLRTRTNVKPVYISVGHLADLDTSIQLVMSCTPKYRLPRPIHEAHNAAGEY